MQAFLYWFQNYESHLIPLLSQQTKKMKSESFVILGFDIDISSFFPAFFLLLIV